MAKYTVNHSCGHDEVVQLVGKHAERDRKLAWLATQDCSECRKAAFNSANAARAEQVKGSFGSEWPALTGSEKQVAWAETIRASLLPAATATMIETEGRMEEARASGQYSAEQVAEAEVMLGLMGDTLHYIRNQASSRFWIDNKSATPERFLLTLTRERRDGMKRGV